MYYSPLTQQHNAMGANWTELFGRPLVQDFGETKITRQRSFRELAIVDLSGLSRMGVKGDDVTRWCRVNRYTIGDVANRAYPQSDGNTVCRLSASELMLLADFDSRSGIGNNEIPEDYRCYTVRRQDSHIWLAVTGRHSAALFAKICGVDVSAAKFPDLSIAQTSVARVSAIVLRRDAAAIPAYHLLADSSYAQYLLKSLRDAAVEFNGQMLGLRAFHEESQENLV